MDDVWSIYRIEEKKINTSSIISLKDLLFRETIHLADKPSESFYCIAHAHFYRLLIAPQGLRHLSRIIKLLC